MPADGKKIHVKRVAVMALHRELRDLCARELMAHPPPYSDGPFDMLNEEFRRRLPVNRADPWGTFTSVRATQLFVLRTALLTVHMHLAKLAVATDGYGQIFHRLITMQGGTSYVNVAEAVAPLCLGLISLVHCGAMPTDMPLEVGTVCLKRKSVLKPFAAALKSPTPSYMRLDGKRDHITVCLPYLPSMLPYFIDRMKSNVTKMVAACPEFTFDVQYCTDKIPKEGTDYTPWSRVARVRNLMVSRLDLDKTDYLLWVDSDLVSYPPDFPRRAIKLNPGNITAPVVLVDGSLSFYDWCGFIGKDKAVMTPADSDAANSIRYIDGRNIGVVPNFAGNRHTTPYLPHDKAYKPTVHPNTPKLVEIDCCGAMYIMPSNILKRDHTDDTFDKLTAVMKRHGVAPTKKVRFEDHPCFTDHYPVCRSHRDYGGKIHMDLGSIAMHANLPEYDIPWAGAGPR